MASATFGSMHNHRRGGATILIMSMLGVLVIAAAFTIDFSYMQLVRTELRAASDAAAKAGAEALSRTQDVNVARQEAIRYAAMNTVGNRPFRLAESDVIIGHSSSNSSGRWNFEAGGKPPNAVRIDARTGGTNAHPATPLFFSRIVGHSGFSPGYQSTAGQQEIEVCLCLDRSGSMNFDMTGVDYSFAPGNPKLSSFTAWGKEWQHMLSPPHPTKSRWAALRGAVDVFLDELVERDTPPRTGLVTWGSDYTMPLPPNTQYQAATTDQQLPSSSSFSWKDSSRALRKFVKDKGDSTIMGGTNLSAGLDRAIGVMTGTNSNAFASKVIVLMTDGEWNQGSNPVASAYNAKSQNITVHSISMLTKQQTVLEDIAEITGGRYFRTQNEEELREAFREIANSLPVVLIE